jgi:L-ascorbate metabolism protein UlaG (beta-lactamase superfamily)
MIITRFGHAAVLVEVAGRRILIDPGTYSSDDAFDLTELDAIAVTHQHADHVDPARIGRLVAANPNALLLAEPETLPKLETGAWVAAAVGKAVRLGSATLTPVGGQHAVIHDDIPRVGNVGYTVAAPGEPTFFHPGDAYETAPKGVDVLGVPLSAPWAKVSEAVEFVRRVAPTTVFPIHDGGLSDVGYGAYWRHIETLGQAERAVRVAPAAALELG